MVKIILNKDLRPLLQAETTEKILSAWLMQTEEIDTAELLKYLRYIRVFETRCVSEAKHAYNCALSVANLPLIDSWRFLRAMCFLGPLSSCIMMF